MASPIIPKMCAPTHMPICIPGAPMNPTYQALAQVQIQPQGSMVPPQGSMRNCIRLRGMPYSASVEDIMQFLGDLRYGILPNGIHMVLNQQGRPSGDAFIQLTSADKAVLAALDVSKGGCHKKHMRERYVEVFQCSGDEMNMVLMGGTLNRNGIQPPPGMSLLLPEQLPVHRPEANPPIPATYAFPTAPSTLMLHPHSQIPLEMLQPQAILPSVAGQRHLYSQPTILPYATYLPATPVSPNVQASAGAVHTLAAAPAGIAPHLAMTQHGHPLSTMGVQVRMQGLSYNSGMSDILTLFKGYGQQSHPAQLYATSATTEYQPTVVDEKIQSPPQISGNQPSEWTCLV